MIKEFIRKKLSELLELGWLEYKVMNRLEELETDLSKFKGCYTNDTTINDQAIRFILDNTKTNKEMFNEFKYYRYKDLPWYVKRLFVDFYKIEEQFNYGISLYYKDREIGYSESYIGELLEKIDSINKSSKGKK